MSEGSAFLAVVTLWLFFPAVLWWLVAVALVFGFFFFFSMLTGDH